MDRYTCKQCGAEFTPREVIYHSDHPEGRMFSTAGPQPRVWFYLQCPQCGRMARITASLARRIMTPREVSPSGGENTPLPGNPRGGPPPPEGTIPLSRLFRDFLAWAKTAHRPTTWSVEIYRSQRWLDYLGNIPIGEITKARVLEVLQDIAERTSGPTANRYLALLRKALSWGVNRGYLEANPLRGLEIYREPPGRTRWLEPGEAERLLKECERIPRLHMFTAMALFTGMRLGEIEALRWRDISFERDTITIPDSKTGQARIIPLEAPLRRLLESWPRAGELVLGKFTHRRAFRAAVKRAGLGDFRFHDLRHTYASWKVMAGVNLRTVAALLGHRTLAMVMRYAHLAPEHLEGARGKGVPPEIGHTRATDKNKGGYNT